MKHKDLDVWKKSMDLAEAIYTITRAFPKEEVYGLTSQIRRAAVSIPSNIAEGCAKKSNKDFEDLFDGLEEEFKEYFAEHLE